MSKIFRLGKLSISLNWVLVLAFVISTMIGADTLLTTIENIRTAAPWWHTAFTAVESLVMLTAVICCILKALQPARPGRAGFYHWILFVACLVLFVRVLASQYEKLVLGNPNVLSWISGVLCLIGWGFICYCAWPGRSANKAKRTSTVN